MAILWVIIKLVFNVLKHVSLFSTENYKKSEPSPYWWERYSECKFQVHALFFLWVKCPPYIVWDISCIDDTDTLLANINDCFVHSYMQYRMSSFMMIKNMKIRENQFLQNTNVWATGPLVHHILFPLII